MSQKNGKVPVLVTTSHRGVFFGYGKPTDTDKDIIRIEKARMCVYWSPDVHGVLGLAANGPTKCCRIGPAAPAIILRGVTSVTEVSQDAAKKFEEEPWS